MASQQQPPAHPIAIGPRFGHQPTSQNNIIRTPALTPDPDSALRLCDNPSGLIGSSPSYFPPNVFAPHRVQSPLSPPQQNVVPPLAKFSPESALAAAAAAAASAKDQAWDKTIERIIKGIVSIKASAVRAFDTEGAGDYTATGFVVDKQRGIILSNRHVVNPAPIIATAVFVNYEEVPLRPIYRDPVHDFGFFQYDTDKVKFLNVEQVDLRPDLAKIGLSIKVVGNDSGEKLSILGSTLARLDRTAPRYGDDVYEDFNTFYFQAATGTSGGSSGSPVLNIAGQAIALNAGGSKRSASSFYLPLDRIVRALSCIQASIPITRGTLQTEFVHKSYDELRRLGLTSSAEALCRQRNPFSTGLLTVSKVLPDGPAHGKLEPGDILVACDGQNLDSFVPLWEILDDRVDSTITLSLYRGKAPFDTDIVVQDLHSITPDRFAEVGGGVFHDLSYQQARSYGMSVKNQGVYVALSGMLNWSSLTRNFLVTSLANKRTPNLDAFLDVLATIPDGKRVPIKHKELGQIRETTGLVQIDRHFHLDHVFVRHDKTGVWDRQSLPDSPVEEPRGKIETTTENYDDEDELDVTQNKSLELIKQGLIYITTRLPFSIHGYTSSRPYYGVGTLLSIENNFPIVACDRATVPSEFVDIRLTIQHYAVSGRVIGMDKLAYLTFNMDDLPPHINLVVPSFDPHADLRVKDAVTVVGLDSAHSVVEKQTSVMSISDVGTTKCNPPRFRLINVEGISLVDSVSCDGGVISKKYTEKYFDSENEEKERDVYKIVAMWTNASSQNSSGNDTFWKTGLNYGAYVKPVVDHINRGLVDSEASRDMPEARTFNFECGEVSLSTAAGLGLSAGRIRQFVKLAKKQLNSTNVRMINVFDNFPHHDVATNTSNDLFPGDILLEIEGSPVVRLVDIEKHLQDKSKDSYDFVILREGQEKTVVIRPLLDMSNVAGTRKVVQWNGAFLHETATEAIEQVAHNTKLVPLTRGVYVGSVSFGAPALNNIRPAQWIIEVDGEPVDNIDQFLELISQKRWSDGQFVRVKQVSRKDVTSVVSVQVNERYWPTRCLERDTNGKWLHTVV
ncbi:hypothetical protein POJ06DRAFT_11254 [Lipomyces tetrasporus]|uniref:PDZ domain-containing protein n=1 Tax=Lipomyces tetrasporus TaxID=54092 RepID=A0AAD7QZ46_9ASCO|nr:uncharacterized protein POJ06DRAFT_11254 [Lipomyces tetrasporus]KAJ8104040.1 hypothetical protein POJ06DRAFT_11254 [Lipomyces tetrasporus]